LILYLPLAGLSTLTNLEILDFSGNRLVDFVVQKGINLSI